MLISALNPLFETMYIYKDFNEGYMCVLFVRVQNCECVDTKCEYKKIEIWTWVINSSVD